MSLRIIYCFRLHSASVSHFSSCFPFYGAIGELFIHEFNLFIRMCLSFSLLVFCFEGNPCRFAFDIGLPFHICFLIAAFLEHRSYSNAVWQRNRVKNPIYPRSIVDKSTIFSIIFGWFMFKDL